jgi:hypothetical protein
VADNCHVSPKRSNPNGKQIYLSIPPAGHHTGSLSPVYQKAKVYGSQQRAVIALFLEQESPTPNATGSLM